MEKPAVDPAISSNPEAGLSETQRAEADAIAPASLQVVHEVVRAQGEEELGRTALSLAASGVAAGVALGASVLARAYLHGGLPKDVAWAPLVSAFGYTTGFVIVILGRLQLFTETTVTAVLPVATHPTRANFGNLLRVWAVVFGANLVGCALVAWGIVSGFIVDPEQQRSVFEISREATAHGAMEILRLGIPAGFLIASIAWILPNAKGSEFWVVVLVTWVIGAGGFSHVVAGATEAFVLWFAGEADAAQTFGGFIAPALLGNILGGSVLFAVLAHAMVRGDK
ncbi:formate/nitrite transporter family protein [Glacieibacterium frigidum]|uniref:Formate/nitrite transporter family protein n=1 Tax=Glacieibacterium frigidum TaxID=2593303 RepID=A0A552UJ05_9SPHN|nr:formate/nitrite transporter family protein [Glacieibacterium frigidum]TRW18203.1 formate/nitrite transporter family protein [Glacieibacterium frigidum]